MSWILSAAVAIAATVALLGSSTAAAAQTRVALVIGNSDYRHTAKLANPKNDATDMAAALKEHGFRVVEGFDLDKAGFDRKIHEFATALAGAEAGILFYAGHGLQVGGRNYLVPIDAKAESEVLLHLEMVRVDDVQRVMEASSKTNVLLLDACRNNPLARNLARAMGTRSTQVGQGLRGLEAGVGTLISFSTAPDTVASDGVGRNSPYAGALVKNIASATDDLNTILINVRRDVRRETQGQQVPWEHSSLEGRFYFGQTPKLDAGAARTSAGLLKIERSPDHPFDGYWLVKMRYVSGCDYNGGSFTHRVAVKNSVIYFAENRAGNVTKTGVFNYAVPSGRYPDLKITNTGKLGGDGTFSAGTCRGTLTAAKEE